jgi:hypothetical protein
MALMKSSAITTSVGAHVFAYPTVTPLAPVATAAQNAPR